MNNDYLAAPFSDPRVDNLEDSPTGVLDTVSALAFEIPDRTLIKNLDNRISDSQTYWDKADGFNLKQTRKDNVRLYLGKHIDQNRLYTYQTPYVENQIYIGEEAIVAYLTSQSPSPEVYPSQDTQQSRIFAQDLEKALKAHSEMFQLADILGKAVRSTLNKHVGFIKLCYDPLYGRNGEIVPENVNPEHIVVDKNAKQGENPAFICHMLKMTANEVLSRWPNKKEEVFTELGIVRGTAKQMEEVILVREVWFTYYDKKYRPQEGLAYYFGNVVLEKVKNPNFIYSSKNKNFLGMPIKPFIPLNFDNDGEHWIDYTGPIAQAASMQDVLNKRGRQLMEVVDKANGLTVFSSESGLTMDDIQNLTGDPNQRMLITTNGNPVSDLVAQLAPPQISPMLMQDKIDLRTQVHAILGTPSEFTGAEDGSQADPTLGQSQMKKNQAAGRQDLFLRSIDRFLTRYFNYLVQMMAVWYDEKHYFVYNGGDGEFDYITMSRDLIEDGTIVTVKSGATRPFDQSRQEVVGLGLAKMGLLSPLDLYKLLNLPNAQQLYDNWAKYKTSPTDLARDAMDEVDSNKAYIAFTEIMNGKDAELPEVVTKEFVLTLRKLMISDDFLKANKRDQAAFLKYVEKAVSVLELKMTLDQVGDSGDVSQLNPAKPLPPYQPQMPQQPMGATSPPTGVAPQNMPPSPFSGMPTPQGGFGANIPPQGVGNPMVQPPIGGMSPNVLAGLPPIQ